MAASDNGESEFGFDFLGRVKDYWQFLTDLQDPSAFFRRPRFAQLLCSAWTMRLLLFLQLQAKQPADADPLVPPPDVALMWAALLIRRHCFLQMLQCSRVADADKLADLSWSAPLPAQLPPEGKQRDQLTHRADTTKRLWTEAYPAVTYAVFEDYSPEQLAALVNRCGAWFPAGQTLAIQKLINDVDWWQLLVNANADVLSAPDAFFARSQQRYRDWLGQFRKTKAEPGTEGPELDIDLWWHVHQMAPKHYIKYCEADDGFANWHFPKADLQVDIGAKINVCPYDSDRKTCCCSGL